MWEAAGRGYVEGGEKGECGCERTGVVCGRFMRVCGDRSFLRGGICLKRKLSGLGRWRDFSGARFIISRAILKWKL